MRAEIPSRWNRPIFVASMGRSGSTLLQRVLNVHPEITIWGEHAGFLSGILASHGVASGPAAVENLKEGHAQRHMVIGELSDTDVFKPWVSPFRADDLSDGIRSMMIDLFTKDLTPDIRWGFKEIRYSDAELTALMEMFPEAHLIVLARDIEGYASSRFFAFGNTDFDLESDDGREKATKRLTTMINGWMKRYQGLLSVRDQYAPRSSVVAYSDLVLGSDRIGRLFDELGENHPRQDAVDAVLGATAGSSFKHNSAARSNRGRLTELVERAEIDRDECARLSTLLGLT